jgi:ribosomal-protein-alanine N-acetyltransferase
MSRAPWTEHVPELSGPLVRAREVAPHDAPSLFELLTDPAVTQYLSSPPPSVDAFVGFIRWAIREREAGNGVTFGIVPHGMGDAVGIVQIRALEPSWFCSEWGFALGSAFWGTGVFHEAAELVMRFAFDTVGADRLEARAVVGNARGNGALQKLAARAEVALSRGFKRADAYDEQLLWSIRAEDWRQGRLFDPERVSGVMAKERIAAAIADVQRHLATERRKISRDVDPQYYPFLLTRPGDRVV